MRMPQLFVKTRWRSKAALIESMLKNKETLTKMFSEIGIDPDMQVLDGHEITAAQWQLLQVRLHFLCVGSFTNMLLLVYHKGHWDVADGDDFGEKSKD